MVGYGVGYVGQSLSYTIVSAYFGFFMTTCVGIGASQAGSIMSVALCLEACAGMILGNLSDNCICRLGRRRPFVLCTSILLPLLTLLLFHTVRGPKWLLLGYYTLVAVLFRISFSAFEIPYTAFGAEVVKDYDQRTWLRTMTRVFSIVGGCIANVLPLRMLSRFRDTPATAWRMTAMLTAVCIFLSFQSSFFLTKEDRYIPVQTCERGRSGGLRSIARSYRSIYKIRAMRILLVYKIAFTVIDAVYGVATTYYLIYCIGVSTEGISNLHQVMAVVYFILLPVGNYTALRLGKARQQKLIFGSAALVYLGVFLSGKTSLSVGILLVVVLSLQQSAFWQISHSIFYDVVEVDEFLNGKRREGDILSMASVIGTTVSAIAIQMFGIMLDRAGFVTGGSIQSAQVGEFLRCAYALVPAFCSTVGFLALRVFPIDKASFDSLRRALRDRENGDIRPEDLEAIQRMI